MQAEHTAAAPATRPEFARGIAPVAGGSGGLGAGVCRLLAKAGSNVALSYRSSKATAYRVADDVRGRGCQSCVQALDLEDAQATKAWVDAMAAQFGHIHSVVYAAGPVTVVHIPVSGGLHLL